MSNEVDKIKYEGMESLVTAVILCDKDLIINISIKYRNALRGQCQTSH